ncbi:hypothetical protein [Mycolicibacterium hodleri]|uniref:Uncharacterized protein n=1 Tax=Mycolicibacterium hodleri TaxID=49897 RepID=A0A502DTV8_9MYCO|nr:hypothetical protein [Mycolicibacterium hodleri]TPG28100.1 hypothetical protein EAH80_28650 [Mycolicibacterium hodleri]
MAEKESRRGPVNALPRDWRGMVLTRTDAVFWVAVAAAVAAVVLRARRSAQPALAGAGDDKPPGYENPTTA